jgi:putative salt-induced outer membrane protein
MPLFGTKGTQMKTNMKIFAATLIALGLGATPTLAQTTLTGTRVLDDRIDDIEENAQDDLERAEDASRYGNPDYRPGLSGSASLGYSGKTGNNETQEFSLGARLRYAQGQFVQTLGVALDFADVDGVKSKEDVFGVYDANYYLNDSFYVFALGRVQTDGLADEPGETDTDAFIGVGPGYRILNSPDVTWRVQAGIGVSYLKDGVGDSETDTGYIASSRFFYGFNDNIFMTNDTDVLTSDSVLRVNNDIGLNFKMTDTFSTRISYLTDYNESRDIRTDNKLGLSLVYGF